jgi:hypothetical protein
MLSRKPIFRALADPLVGANLRLCFGAEEAGDLGSKSSQFVTARDYLGIGQLEGTGPYFFKHGQQTRDRDLRRGVAVKRRAELFGFDVVLVGRRAVGDEAFDVSIRYKLFDRRRIGRRGPGICPE